MSPSSRALDEYLEGVKALEPFAESVGVTRVSLWRYREGKAMPSAAVAASIERATEGKVPANGWALDSTDEKGAA